MFIICYSVLFGVRLFDICITKIKHHPPTDGKMDKWGRSPIFSHLLHRKKSLKAITQYAFGSTFKEVSGTVLKTVKVCLPASEVVERFTNKVDSIFKRQDVLEQENQHLTISATGSCLY